MLTQDLASRFAVVALGHVTREYPNKLDHVLGSADDLLSPRALHPSFFGSFDWHSCVHAHWMLARLLRRYPALPEAQQIRDRFDAAFAPANVAVEVAYLARPESRGFERPYGWAWLLMLGAELHRLRQDGGGAWWDALQPLAVAFSQRFQSFLPKATYPVRAGAHTNTAFGLALAIEYAEVCGDAALAGSVRETVRRWYLGDADCPAWEPSGDDFLSPCLAEAECMRRVLLPVEFAAWFGRFLPRLDRAEPATLFQPAVVSDRGDGKIAHLDGLNLSRAWCWRSLATALAPADPRRTIMQQAATQHLDASLPHISGDYMGEHWLATFALLALEA